MKYHSNILTFVNAGQLTVKYYQVMKAKEQNREKIIGSELLKKYPVRANQEANTCMLNRLKKTIK